MQFLQTMGPYTYMIYSKAARGFYGQGAPTEQEALIDTVQFAQERGPYKQKTPT